MDLSLEKENKDLQIVAINNPFRLYDKEIKASPWYAGITISEVLKNYVYDDISIRVYYNGTLIEKEQYDHICPRPGDMITVVPELQGGGGNTGKMILKSILMIGITIAGFWAGGALGLTGVWLGAFVSGVSIVGGLLVNALLPMQVDTPKIGDNTDSSSYSWSPGTTQSQGVVIPKFYGVNRLYGNIIMAYVETVRSDQYYNMLICMGTGPYKKLYDFRLNDQSTKKFQEARIYTRLGNLNQNVIHAFDAIKLHYPASVKVSGGDSYTYTTTGTDFDKLEVEVTFPNGIWHQGEEGIEDSSVSYRVEVKKVGSSTWINLTEGQTTVPGTNTWSTTEHWSAGREVPYMNSNGEESYRWTEVFAGESSYADANDIPYHNEGDIYDSEHPFTVEWKWISNEYITTHPPDVIYYDYIVVHTKKTAPIHKKHVYRVPVDAHGQYNVRVSKLSAEQGNQMYGDDLYFSGVREVTAEKLEYPLHVLVGVRVKATEQLSGSLRFSCKGECSVIRVWDGSAWTIRYNNNPAWVTYDILTQPVIGGLGTESSPFVVHRYDGIDPSRIDTTAFKEWADFCNELVSDGNGGTEKRVTFNGGFDYDTTMWEAASRVSQIGMAVLVWNGSNLTVAVDKSADAVALWTVGDITEGSFTENFLPLEERATEIEVDYINQENDYSRDKLILYQPDESRNGFRASLDLFGVTKPSEAWRAAMRRLMNNKYVARSLTVKRDIETLNASIGDIIDIQHDVPLWGEGGRIVSATASSVTLDQSVTIQAGLTYKIVIRSSGDVVQERTVSNTPGTYTVLNVSPSFSPTPAQYDVYAFGQTDTLTKAFRITGLKRNNDLTFDVNLTEYREEVYQYESEVPPSNPDITEALKLLLPRDVDLEELDLMHPDGRRAKGIKITIDPSTESSLNYYEVWYKVGKWSSPTDWIYAGHADNTDTTYEILWLEKETKYTVTLIPVRTDGRKLHIDYCPSWQIKLRDYRPYKVFQRDDEPTSGMMIGDRWIDTNDSDKMYWYDGSAWVAISIPEVTGVVTVDGSGEFYSKSCEISWDEPDITTGDVPPYDEIAYYEVTVRDPSDNVLRGPIKRAKPNYTYTYYANSTDNNQSPIPSFKFRVKAVDLWGNKSATWTDLTATAPVPEDVATADITVENSDDGRTKKGVTTEITWVDQATLAKKMNPDRIRAYIVKIYSTAVPLNLRKSINVGNSQLSFEITPDLNEQIFGGTISSLFYVGIVVKDVFGQLSTPQLIEVNTTGVPAINSSTFLCGNGTTTFNGMDCNVQWDDIVSSSFAGQRFDYYRVRIYSAAGVLKRTKRNGKSEHFTYAIGMNGDDFGVPGTPDPSPTFKIGVTVIDKHGDEGSEVIKQFYAATPPQVANLRVVGQSPPTYPNPATFDERDLHFEWDSAISDTFPKKKFRRYRIRIKDDFSGTVKRTRAVYDSEESVYTYRMNKKDFTTATRTFVVGISVQDIFGQYSTETEVKFTNSSPDMSGVTPTITSGVKGIRVNWSTYEDSVDDIQKYLIYCDTTNPPTTLFKTVSAQQNETWLNILYSNTFYLKIIPRDHYGNGTATTVQSFVTTDIACNPNICASGHDMKEYTGGVDGYAFWSEILYNDGSNGKTITNKGFYPGDTLSIQARGCVESATKTDLRLKIVWEYWDGAAFQIAGSDYVDWTTELHPDYIKKFIEGVEIPEDDGASPTPHTIARVRIIASSIGAYSGYSIYIKKIKVEVGPVCTLYQRAINQDILDDAVNRNLTIADGYSVQDAGGYVRLTGTKGLELIREDVTEPTQGRRINFTTSAGGTVNGYYSCFFKTGGGTSGSNLCTTRIFNTADAGDDGYMWMHSTAPYRNTIRLSSDSTSEMAMMNIQVQRNAVVIGQIHLETQGGTSDTKCQFTGFGEISFNAPLTLSASVGTAPLIVTSTTAVANLNSDMVDGKHQTDFVVLAGRSGGQEIYGGTASGNDLILKSTSNATLGTIIFGANLAGFDETRQSLIIGSVTAPSNGTNTVVLVDGTAPSTAYTGGCILYSDADGGTYDNGSGSSQFVLTSGGKVIKLFQATALTVKQTGTMSVTAPGLFDGVFGAGTNSSAWGFTTQDEFKSAMTVLINLRSRVNDIENRLVAWGFLPAL